MSSLLNDLVRQVSRMDMTDMVIVAIFFIVVGMFFLRGSVFRPK